MLSREYLREHAHEYRKVLGSRGSNADLDRFLERDAERRRTIARVEMLKNQRNVASQEIATLKKSKQDASAQIEAMKRVGDEIKELDAQLASIEEDLGRLELDFPNVTHESLPPGRDESANRVERTWGEKPQFDFEPKAHWDIGEKLDILDFDRGAKITGARFTLIKGDGARLNRALIDFMLDAHGARGYQEVVPPYIVNADSLRATGQLPK
ncbi:MAG TPA: serine--tRNA ligase, partial [Thermoanaerobaculia bacterium]|nr:serine--tRNA ligase [Thermoanaerobaculia bacterium]